MNAGYDEGINVLLFHFNCRLINVSLFLLNFVESERANFIVQYSSEIKLYVQIIILSSCLIKNRIITIFYLL